MLLRLHWCVAVVFPALKYHEIEESCRLSGLYEPQKLGGQRNRLSTAHGGRLDASRGHFEHLDDIPHHLSRADVVHKGLDGSAREAG